MTIEFHGNKDFLALTSKYEQLKTHDRMQKEFINIAAHELRNPIQPLVLSSESLKGSMPDEERVSIVK